MGKKWFWYSLILLGAISWSHAGEAKIPGLMAGIYPIPHVSEDTSSEVKALRETMLDAMETRLSQILYPGSGKEKAYQEGRRIFKDYDHGTITLVDTQSNLNKAQDYIQSLRTPPTTLNEANNRSPALQSKIITLRHADPGPLRNLLNQILQESRSSPASSGNTSRYITGTLAKGPGNGITFEGLSAELIEILGTDSSNYQAKLYLITQLRDREITLAPGQSERIDAWRVRLTGIDAKREEAEVEIRKFIP